MQGQRERRRRDRVYDRNGGGDGDGEVLKLQQDKAASQPVEHVMCGGVHAGEHTVDALLDGPRPTEEKMRGEKDMQAERRT